MQVPTASLDSRGIEQLVGVLAGTTLRFWTKFCLRSATPVYTVPYRLRKIGKKTTPALDFAEMRIDLLLANALSGTQGR